MRTLLAIFLTAFSVGAHGAVITSPVDPLLAGATVITFSELPLGTSDPTIAGVSFTGDGVAAQIVSTVGNADTPDLNNNDVNVDILFASPVTAFGMDLLLVDRAVTVSAFDALGALLGSAILVSPIGTVSSGFRGIGDVGPIASARVDTDEFIRIDNFYFVTGAVPEPGALCLTVFGLAALVFGRRRRT